MPRKRNELVGLLLEQGCPCLGALLALYIIYSITGFHYSHCCTLCLCTCFTCVVSQINWIGIDLAISIILPNSVDLCNAAVTPDTCSPDTSSIHLYPLSRLHDILYRRQNCRHGYMYLYLYPGIEHCLYRSTRTPIRRHVDGYKLLVRDACARLHVSGVNAAYRTCHD